MSPLQTQLPTETWVTATWDDYLQVSENPNYQKAKFYYNNGQFRIEMSPVGKDHASDHYIIGYAMNLYAVLKKINLNGYDNCTYRKTGIRAAQPDLSYYVGETVDAIPYGTSAANLDRFPAPALVVEIANISFVDDKGEKRLLYEDLGIQEYWIVDVKKSKIIAFEVQNSGSFRIQESQVLPGLQIVVLEDALRRTRHSNHSQVGAWLLEQFRD